MSLQLNCLVLQRKGCWEEKFISTYSQTFKFQVSIEQEDFHGSSPCDFQIPKKLHLVIFLRVLLPHLNQLQDPIRRYHRGRTPHDYLSSHLLVLPLRNWVVPQSYFLKDFFSFKIL